MTIKAIHYGPDRAEAELRVKSISQAQSLIRRSFDPKKWRKELVNRMLPVLAVGMARSMVGQMLAVGVDVRGRGRRKALADDGASGGTEAVPVAFDRRRRRKPKSVTLLTKVTTASRWLDEHPDDLDELEEMLEASGVAGYSVLTELPEAMKERIAEHLKESFAQDYWDGISETTGGNAETILSRGLEEGASIRDMADELTERLGGDLYAEVRARNIARTESGGALNGARSDAMEQLQEDLGDRVPMKRTWLSVLGPTTRDTHAELDGVPEDEDGMFDVGGEMAPYPGYVGLSPGERCNCFPAGTLVSGNFVGAQRGWYEGALAKIVTRSGAELTLTPNHPVVTSKGLVAAGMLKPGDQVLAYCSKVDRLAGSATAGSEASIGGEGGDILFPAREQVQHEPAAIENLFQAFAAWPGVAVEVRDPSVGDFYGDGESFKGQIEVVRAGGKLLKHREPGQLQERGDPVLVPAVDDLASELCPGVADPPGHGVWVGSPGLPCPAEQPTGELGPVGRVAPSGSLAVGVAADFDSSLSESAAKDGPTVTGFLRDALERYAGLVQFDEVVEVRYLGSSGHVYDLQSVHGFIIANDPGPVNTGIVVSNCQCSIVMEMGMDDVEARGIIQDFYDRQGEEETEEE